MGLWDCSTSVYPTILYYPTIINSRVRVTLAATCGLSGFQGNQEYIRNTIAWMDGCMMVRVRVRMGLWHGWMGAW